MVRQTALEVVDEVFVVAIVMVGMVEEVVARLVHVMVDMVVAIVKEVMEAVAMVVHVLLMAVGEIHNTTDHGKTGRVEKKDTKCLTCNSIASSIF